jgi:hypothetical protein
MRPTETTDISQTLAPEASTSGHRTKAEMIARLIRQRDQALCKGDSRTAASLSRRLALRLTRPED